MSDIKDFMDLCIINQILVIRSHSRNLDILMHFLPEVFKNELSKALGVGNIFDK